MMMLMIESDLCGDTEALPVKVYRESATGFLLMLLHCNAWESHLLTEMNGPKVAKFLVG